MFNVDRCLFTSAAIENVLLGNTDLNYGSDDVPNDDISCVCFNNCYFLGWESQVPIEPVTRAHVAHNAYEGLGNTFIGCQFNGTAGVGVPISTMSGITWSSGVATVTTTGPHGLVSGQSVIFTGTGTALDTTQETNNTGFMITVPTGSATTFTFSYPSSISGSGGHVYKLGYPLYGVVAAAGRCAMYNCIDVGIGICTVFAPTPPAYPLGGGGISIYEAESQSANFADIQGEHAGVAGQMPVVISGLRHGDIFGFGSYSVIWSRGESTGANSYTSLNIVGGNLGRGFVQNSNVSNVTLAGPQFSATYGAVSGSHTNLINGWWMVDMVQQTQFASAVQAPSVQTPSVQIASSSTIYSGSGVPSNSSLGANGDYYFRSDDPGTSGHRIYVKAAGAWNGVV